jgi:acetyl esterase/lipase
MIRTSDQSTAFGRNSSLFEFTSVNIATWCLSRLNTHVLGDIIFSKNLCILFFLFRRYRHGATYLGDSTYKSYYSKDVQGVWIRSPHRRTAHDLIIYFVHGSGFARVSVYAYLEFLTTLLVALQMQGFRNPAIFAIDYSQQSKFNSQLSNVTRGWNYICNEFAYSNLVLLGDSNGATLSLSFLLHAVQPYPRSVSACSRQPLAAILISPATYLFSPKTATSTDIMTPNTLMRYSKSYKDHDADSTDVYHSPGLARSTEWWARALPERGTILIYGQEEMLAPEIEELYSMLKQCGKVKLEGEQGQLHSWPTVMTVLGRSRQAKEAGSARIANSLAKMVLW